MNLNEIPERLFNLFKEPGTKVKTPGPLDGCGHIAPLKGYADKQAPPFLSLLRPSSADDISVFAIYNSEEDVRTHPTGQLLIIRANPRLVTFHTNISYGLNLADPDTGNILEVIEKARELVLECTPVRAPV